MGKLNNYLKGKSEILKVFSVKGYKTWTGREGYGGEATLYYEGKKIGYLLDEGNGGEASLEAIKDNYKVVKDFLEALPKYKIGDYWKEELKTEYKGSKSRLESWTVYEFASIMLLDAEEKKNFKKSMKKGVVVMDKNKIGITVFKVTSEEAKTDQFNDFAKKKYPNMINLNIVSEEKAYEYWKKYQLNFDESNIGMAV